MLFTWVAALEAEVAKAADRQETLLGAAVGFELAAAPGGEEPRVMLLQRVGAVRRDERRERERPGDASCGQQWP